MIPGANLIIKCPACQFLHQRESLISGNTFGAEYFSDGKRDAPMLPDFPYFVKCNNQECGVFFKIDKSVFTGECHDQSDTKAPPMVAFLTNI